jgi:hypothetical protein
MGLENLYVYDLILWVLVLCLGLTLIVGLVAKAIEAITKPSEHEQRLMRMQMEQQHAQREVDGLTRDYLRRLRK